MKRIYIKKYKHVFHRKNYPHNDMVANLLQWERHIVQSVCTVSFRFSISPKNNYLAVFY
jgi:hypothetical protein